MPREESLWSSINTLFETGLELLRLMNENSVSKGAWGEAAAEKLAEGVLLVADDKNVMLAIDKSAAQEMLSEEAIKLGQAKGWFLCYPNAASAVPIFELSKSNGKARDCIVSDESLRATLCGNYPEYVKTHNMSTPPEEHIKDADAPPYLFLQKQLDNASFETLAQVAEYQLKYDRAPQMESGLFDDVLELER